MAVAYRDGTIRVWSMSSGSLINTIETGVEIEDLRAIEASDEIAVHYRQRPYIDIFDLESGEKIAELKSASGWPMRFGFSWPKNKLLISVTGGGVYQVWDRKTWTCRHVLEHRGVISSKKGASRRFWMMVSDDELAEKKQGRPLTRSAFYMLNR